MHRLGRGAIAYAGALDNGFVNFDDGQYVFETPMVRKGLSAPSVTWAFRTRRSVTMSPPARNGAPARREFADTLSACARSEPRGGSWLSTMRAFVAFLKFADTAIDVDEDDKVSAAGRAQGVAFTYGKGRVVVLGEAAQLSAQVYGLPPEPMSMNVPGCDNRQMALNIMHWLSGLME